MSLNIRVLSGQYAVCRLKKDAPVPRWAQGRVVSICRSETELSIICESKHVPSTVEQDAPWACLMLEGPLPLSAVGILSSLLGPLAAADINIMAFSSYDTDYILVPLAKLDRALQALSVNGFNILR